MDIARSPDVIRKKKMRRALYGAVALVAIILITVGVSRLQPAAPSVERATVWIDTVKRGSMIRQVRGSGTLVPEEIRWVTATTTGRIERIVLRPGAKVAVGTVILEMSNQQLQQDVMDAKLAHTSAQAAFQNRKAELESQILSQESNVASIESNYKKAVLTLAANEQLAKDQLISAIALKQSQSDKEELENRLKIEKKRLEMTKLGVQSQLAPQEADVNQRRAAYDLRLRQLEDLKVKSTMDGVFQVFGTGVEVGAQVNQGQNLIRVANPLNLKAELRIAETQTRDIAIGQPAEVDTRNGTVKGRVSRIDPASANGTVGVDITLEGALPPGARPDLSVDGTIRLELLENVIYVGRPAFGQENSTVSLFRVGADGEAVSVPVKLGRSSVSTIEILEGLQPGDQVILSDMSSYDEYRRIKLSS
jgi:HlyD family secretion protein